MYEKLMQILLIYWIFYQIITRSTLIPDFPAKLINDDQVNESLY